MKPAFAFTAGFAGAKTSEAAGLRFPLKAPRFTVTSIHGTPSVPVPRATGVMWMPLPVSEKVLPIRMAQSSLLVVSGVKSSSDGLALLMLTSPKFTTTPSFIHLFDP